MSGYKAIGFVRQGGSGRLEVFTSTVDATVDTQVTAITNTNKFSSGAYQGVAVVSAWLYTGAQVTNFANNVSTRIKSYGARTLITGGTFQDNPEMLGKYGVVVLTNAAGANNNLDIEDFNVAKLASATGGFSISGLQNGKAGKTVTLLNATSQILTITNQGGSSDEENRIITGTGGNLAVAGPCAVTFTYDSNASRWNLVSSSKLSVGSGGVVDSIVAGANIAIDATDPANPIAAFDGILPLVNGGTGAALVDPAADRILFWDDSAGAFTFLTPGANLAITTTTIAGTTPQVIAGSTSGAAFAASNFYQAVGFNATNSATANAGRAFIVPFSGTVSRLFMLGDAVAVGTNTITVYKNGVATTLTVTLGVGSATGSDLVNTFSVVAGDYLHLGTGAADDISEVAWSFQIVPT